MIRPPPKPTLFPYPTLSRSPSAGSRRAPAVSVPCPRSGGRRGRRGRGLSAVRERDRARRPGVVGQHRRARRSEEHTSELQSRQYLVCRLLLEKKNPLLPTNLLSYLFYLFLPSLNLTLLISPLSTISYPSFCLLNTFLVYFCVPSRLAEILSLS